MVPRRTFSDTFCTATKPLNSFVSPRVSRMMSSAMGGADSLASAGRARPGYFDSKAPQVGPRLDVLRVQGERALVGGARLLAPPCELIGIAEVVPGAGAARGLARRVAPEGHLGAVVRVARERGGAQRERGRYQCGRAPARHEGDREARER